MYKVIMAPTDGSATGQAAIALATRLAQRFDAELRLVGVDTPQMMIEPLAGTDGFVSTEKAMAEARLARLRKLEALGTECRTLGEIRVITALEEGPTAKTLRDYAERFNVDLIVMASHARGGIARITLGSVTDYLIRNTEVPVLVVKPPVAFTSSGAGESVNRIVVPLDGSGFAEEILPQVALLASGLNATVSLLQVLTPVTYSQKQIMQPGLPWWNDDIAAANDYLEGVAAYLTEAGITVSKDVVLSESAVGAILDYATRARADLIAIATRGTGGLGRLVFGSVADEVTRKATTSILVFHPRTIVSESKDRDAAAAERYSAV